VQSSYQPLAPSIDLRNARLPFHTRFNHSPAEARVVRPIVLRVDADFTDSGQDHRTLAVAFDVVLIREIGFHFVDRLVWDRVDLVDQVPNKLWHILTALQVLPSLQGMPASLTAMLWALVGLVAEVAFVTVLA